MILIFFIEPVGSFINSRIKVIPNKVIKKNDSFVVYIKEDGLYYSYLNSGEKNKIHEGKEFSYPLISKLGDYIAYTKEGSIYIYDVNNKQYEKISERIDYFDNFYDWIDDDTIVYSGDEPGFTIYNVSTKERREHLDKYHYDNFKAANNNIIYAKRINEWTSEEGDFASIMGIVEIFLKR